MPKSGWTQTTLSLVGFFWAMACGPVDEEHPAKRLISFSSLDLRWPAEAGPVQRPLVEFDHRKHTDTLKKEGCELCHPRDDKGLDASKLTKLELPLAREARIDLVHAYCLGCHRTRSRELKKALPVDCGECHVVRPPGVTRRVSMVQDQALHFRHVRAYDKNACDRCHHATAVGVDKLVYIKGKETPCKDCHGSRDSELTLLSKEVKRPPSWRHAAHKACLRCHEDEAKKGTKTGPLSCEGCHDPASQARLERPKEIARLKAGQPDLAWVGAKAAAFHLVLFPHEFHEKQIARCQECHHQTQKPCFTCHTAAGKEEGGQISLSAAFHQYNQHASCVGCHQEKASQGECRGCHRQPVPAAPQERTCRICHSGIVPRPGEPLAKPLPLPLVELTPLPPFSPEEFPEKVVIKAIAAQYQPTEMPHGKMVKHLDALVRKSALASRFHGSTQLLCTGCHHHTPPGSRPPSCPACHGPAADPLQDKPSLKAAYHRMCMDCHQAIQIKALGCVDCHKKAAALEESP